ncbi:hypothetical protein ACJX0J_035592, partial [Zea mays]
EGTRRASQQIQSLLLDQTHCHPLQINNGNVYDVLGGRDDARQRRRERERVRYATMSAEKKNELKKR